MSKSYYNEHDPFAAEWLRQLILAGHIAPGDVDERSIVDVHPGDLAGYTQCHFFAGIGVWSYALRRAGWPDDRTVWTGSCPCQPFSAAGKGKGEADERHLWPHFYRLIRERRPATVFGEQVAAAIGHGWLDLVQSDLEGEGYALGKAVLGACSVGAPHIRQRLYFVADSADLRYDGWRAGEASGGTIESERPRHAGLVADSHQEQCGRRPDSELLPDGETGGRLQGDRQPEPDRQADSTLAGVDPVQLWLRTDEHPSKSGDFLPKLQPDCKRISDLPKSVQLNSTLANSYGGNAGAEGIQRGREYGLLTEDSGTGVVAHTPVSGCGEERPHGGRIAPGDRAQGISAGLVPSEPTGVAQGDTHDAGLEGWRLSAQRARELFAGPAGVAGFWADADWIFCRDGKYRPVESIHVKVVDGTPPSMGRLCPHQKESEKVNVLNPNVNPGKKVQGLRGNYDSPQDERGSDGSQEFQSEGLLQPFMHGEGDGRADKSTECKELPQAVRQDGKCNLSKLRQGESSTACSSPRREPHEQRECQLGDALRLLPQSLSLAKLYGDRRSESCLHLLRDAFLQEAALLPASVSAEEAWASLSQEAKNRVKLVFDASRWELVAPFPLSKGSHSRVGRLRGYGNAICAETAKEFIAAYMETQA